MQSESTYASKSLQNISGLEGQKQLSAFQPYKRQADPFVGAPFDHVEKRASPECSMTPTRAFKQDRRRSKEKKSNANREVIKLETEEVEDDSRSEEIIEVISKGSNFNTPSHSSKNSTNQNPFINAPFTATKKTIKVSMFPSNVKEAKTLGSGAGRTSSETAVTVVKPTIAVKPDMGLVKPEIANKPTFRSPPSQGFSNLARNLNSELNVNIKLIY